MPYTEPESYYVPHPVHPTTDGANGREAGASLRVVMPAVLEGWRVIMGSAMVLALVAVIVAVIIPRRYRAQESLVTVSSKRGVPGGGASLAAAASLLGSGIGADGGLQASPAMVVQFSQLDGVLRSVALDTLGGRRLIERVEDEPLDAIAPSKIPQLMRDHIQAQYDRQTGVITIGAVHRDSALARALVTRVVDATRVAFQAASRAQAEELREAQAVRVDSAAHRLRRAEEALVAFSSSNRGLMSYSNASLTRASLQRELDLAESVYRDAVADRESAVAKELEETPAVVVIDPIPPALTPMSRFAIPAALFAAIGGAILGLLWILVGLSVRSSTEHPNPMTRRTARALLAVPVVGWIAARAAGIGRRQPAS